MNTSIKTKRKAVSPVIATVILIAVAVALGIAVAFWASGLTSSFSKYEKLGVSTQYAVISSGDWNVTLGGQNTGSSDASVTQIQINGIPITASSVHWGTATSGASCITSGNPGSNQKDSSGLPFTVTSGSSFCISFLAQASAGSSSQIFNHGQTIQVTIITAAGNNYPASIVLP
ncbi:MAG: archaellin/type IV pilin N-terminal domain-containing protein [Conexivisphaerales archaeon]